MIILIDAEKTLDKLQHYLQVRKILERGWKDGLVVKSSLFWQRTWVLLPAPTKQITPTCNSCWQGSNASDQSRHLASHERTHTQTTHMHMRVHKHRTNTPASSVNISCSFLLLLTFSRRGCIWLTQGEGNIPQVYGDLTESIRRLGNGYCSVLWMVKLKWWKWSYNKQ